MVDFKNIIDEGQASVWDRVYSVLGRGQRSVLAKDGDKANSHSITELEEVKTLMWDYCSAGRTGCVDLETAKMAACDSTVRKLEEIRSGSKPKWYAKDGIMNPVNGIGTLSDPNQFSFATTPVSISPFEATSLYATGGIPQIIVDKKSKGILQNGLSFKTHEPKFWTNERMDELIANAYKTGFEKVCSDSLRDGTIYGGSFMYPVLKKDNAVSFAMGVEQLIGGGRLAKGSISHWATADRWNTVFLPSYNLSASDYLYPKELYVPVSGISVSTERGAIIRPKQLPYWASITNMGWGQSEFEGWITSVYAYYMVVMSIPIMAQQMSLLLYQMPFDSLEAQIGVETVREIMEINEEKMKEWSILNPKAVNMVGEVVTINRTFSGFEHFMDAVVTDLMARAELARPLIFHTPSKGFADNTTESLLKQSETIKMRQREIEPMVKNCTTFLIANTYGTDSKEWEMRDDVFMSFDRPVVATDKDKAEIGARMAASVSSLVQANIPPQDAINIASQFFPSAKISDEVLVHITSEYEKGKKLEEKAANAQIKAQSQPGGGNPASAITGKGNAGKSGKPPKQHGASNTSAKDSVMGWLRNIFKGRELTEAQALDIIEELSGENPE
jgi:hypothetical protein